MTLEELQKKFYYVQVSNKYEILRAHDLLEKLDIKLLEDDEHKLKILKLDDSSYLKNSFSGSYFLIKGNDGWRIQTHFLGTDNTIKELGKEVYIYLRKKEKSELSEEEREKMNKEISKIDDLFQSFLCYFYLNFKDESDIKSIKSELSSLFSRESNRYNISYDEFKNRDDFKQVLESFLRDKKLNKVLEIKK
jgi:hypothetical protein